MFRSGKLFVRATLWKGEPEPSTEQKSNLYIDKHYDVYWTATPKLSPDVVGHGVF